MFHTPLVLKRYVKLAKVSNMSILKTWRSAFLTVILISWWSLQSNDAEDKDREKTEMCFYKTCKTSSSSFFF